MQKFEDRHRHQVNKRARERARESHSGEMYLTVTDPQIADNLLQPRLAGIPILAQTVDDDVVPTIESERHKSLSLVPIQ